MDRPYEDEQYTEEYIEQKRLEHEYDKFCRFMTDMKTQQNQSHEDFIPWDSI